MRVLIADERHSVRTALRAVLEQDPLCEGIDEAADASAALVALDFGADVALVEWGLPGLHSVALIKVMRARHPAMVIVVLGRFSDARQQATLAGANCYIDTNEPPEHFLRILHELCPGWQVSLGRSRAAVN